MFASPIEAKKRFTLNYEVELKVLLLRFLSCGRKETPLLRLLQLLLLQARKFASNIIWEIIENRKTTSNYQYTCC